MQINPQEKIGLTALISDPSDTTPYFVRCVMRDSQTNATLGSVKLTQDPNNTRRYFGYLEAPSNNTPTGRHINITTSIYTDSGYSVYSLNYQEVMEKYVVAIRWSLVYGGGGGDLFGTSPDVRKIVIEAMRDIIEPVFGRLSKLVGAPRSAKKAAVDPDSEKRIIDAVRASRKPQETIKEMGRLADSMESLHALVEAADTDDAKKKLADAVEKITAAADTVYSSFLYSSISDVPMPKPRVPERKGPSAADAMKDTGSVRKPSEGVVPVHIIVRNRKALGAPQA